MKTEVTTEYDCDEANHSPAYTHCQGEFQMLRIEQCYSRFWETYKDEIGKSRD